MRKILTIGLFCAALLLCVIGGFPTLYAMLFGLVLFMAYGLRSGFSLRELLAMSKKSLKPLFGVLRVFLFVSMLTAAWRASGAIAVIICYAVRLIRPQIFLLLTFLLNCAVSFLTGTSFGTAATMGVICMTMANSMGISPALTGGAVLSGVFFGDRCSPVSSSAHLVCSVTETNIYTNVTRMLRSGLVPFLLSCAIYLAIGIAQRGGSGTTGVEALFAAHFRLHPLALLPVAAVLVLSILRVRVEITMLVSVGLAIPLCLFLQGMDLGTVLQTLVLGYRSGSPDIAPMIDGGGIISMATMAGVVILSSAYAGIFSGTGLLSGVQDSLVRLSRRVTPFGCMVLTALLTAAVTCNQTLCITMTDQLCGGMQPDRQELAIELEDSAALIPALVPWSIAGTVPLSYMDAPKISILFACFLYLLPLWGLVYHNKRRCGGRNDHEDCIHSARRV